MFVVDGRVPGIPKYITMSVIYHARKRSDGAHGRFIKVLCRLYSSSSSVL